MLWQRCRWLMPRVLEQSLICHAAQALLHAIIIPFFFEERPAFMLRSLPETSDRSAYTARDHSGGLWGKSAEQLSAYNNWVLSCCIRYIRHPGCP